MKDPLLMTQEEFDAYLKEKEDALKVAQIACNAAGKAHQSAVDALLKRAYVSDSTRASIRDSEAKMERMLYGERES